jgi:hypothetical protein
MNDTSTLSFALWIWPFPTHSQMNTWRSQVDELQSTLNKEQKNPVDLDATALVGADGRPAELMSVDT